MRISTVTLPSLSLVATLPTENTLPGVALPPGSVMVTSSPTATVVCWLARMSTLTCRSVEDASKADWFGPAGRPRRGSAGRSNHDPYSQSVSA
jgi:hypothetical protein